MKKVSKITLAVALAALSGAAFASDNWTSGADESLVWKSGDGELCWQNNFATPETTVCGEQKAASVAADKVELAADTTFAFDKAVLRPEGVQTLKDLVAKIQNAKLESVIAVGHTDSTGPEAYNQGLSERRAQAVKTFLVNQGVPAELIVAEGRGESQPVASNSTSAGRAKNRRVDVTITTVK